MNTKQKIYALFTAINKYKYIRGLNGCINDANSISEYIAEAAQAQERELIPKKLYDKDATKAAIAKQIIEHLGQATENDICLFYFSGHGGQEDAHSAFEKHESDGKLEVLVCYDSHKNRKGSFLADKELRYLIHQLYQKTKAQIVAIFDCCHSGGNTKNTLTLRRLMDDAEGREWKDFIFGEKISAEAVKNADSLEDVMPQGKHLQMAACEDKQSAYESKGQGIFTSNLVDLLRQSNGKINYQNLISILGLKITSKRFPQKPQVYAYGDDQAVFQSFLGGITQHQKHHANIVFNKEKNAWFLDRGAIHGIQKENTDLHIEVIDAEGKLQKAHIVAIHPNKTQIDFENGDFLQGKSVGVAHISGWTANSLQVYLSGEQAGLDTWSKHWENSNQRTSSIKRVDSLEIADYWVEAKENAYHIYHSFEDSLPLTETIEGYEQKSVQLLVDYLESIAQWTFAKNLNNPDTNLQPNPPIDLQIFVQQSDAPDAEALIGEGQLVLEYTEIPKPKSLSESPSAMLKIRLHNPTDRSYYCALLYLSQDFSINPQVLEGSTVELLSGKEVWAFGGQYIPDEQSPYIRHYNWEAETHHLLLIVSTHPFDVTSLTQEGLPTPKTEMYGEAMNKKVWKIHKVPQLMDWTTSLVELKMKNPYHVKVEELDVASA